MSSKFGFVKTMSKKELVAIEFMMGSDIGPKQQNWNLWNYPKP